MVVKRQTQATLPWLITGVTAPFVVQSTVSTNGWLADTLMSSKEIQDTPHTFGLVTKKKTGTQKFNGYQVNRHVDLQLVREITKGRRQRRASVHAISRVVHAIDTTNGQLTVNSTTGKCTRNLTCSASC